jgi:hypothetical protein
MIDPIVLPIPTDKGIAAMEALIKATSKVENPSDRLAARDALLADPELFQPHPAGILIDRAARFDTALGFCEAVSGPLSPLGVSVVNDRYVNAGLLAVYMDQLVGAKAKGVKSYFLGVRGNGVVRNYRNGIWVFLRFYPEHLLHPGGVVTLLLENCLPHQIINPLEKLAQQPNIISASGALDIVGLGFLNQKGKFVRPSPKETGGVRVKTEKALQELSTIFFTQAGKNYDIGSMTSAQLVTLMPDTPTLAYFKRRVKKALAARNKAQKEPVAC